LANLEVDKDTFAEEVDVCVKTSFFMRHRMLDVINLSLKNDKVEGIVEVDEVFVRLNRYRIVSII